MAASTSSNGRKKWCFVDAVEHAKYHGVKADSKMMREDTVLAAFMQ
ncbi:hypothetical protein KFE80_03235 [bacterium SCSIO 12696]|nr:hypothetical protein KFE80_03235 [bacterium SCSIO 12696]